MRSNSAAELTSSSAAPTAAPTVLVAPRARMRLRWPASSRR
jgi:hypothetical protein